MKKQLNSQSSSHYKFNFVHFCLGQYRLGTTFWVGLIFGTLFWFILLILTALTVGGLNNAEEMQRGGLAILIVAVIMYLWGFVFSYASLKSAFATSIRTLHVATTLAICIYILSMLGGLFFFIHTMFII